MLNQAGHVWCSQIRRGAMTLIIYYIAFVFVGDIAAYVAGLLSNTNGENIPA